MGLLNIFKKKHKVTHEVFGELGYTKCKDKSNNFYEGAITFDSQQCGIMLVADENGPTPAQKDFFKELSNNYPALKKEVIIPFLNNEMKNWIDNNPITDFDREFELDGILLEAINGKPVEWSLTLFFYKIDHYATIEFRDWVPQPGIVIDG